MDYTLALPGIEAYTITILPGEVADKVYSIFILEDSLLEEDETIIMTLNSTTPIADLNPNLSRITIFDNDGGYYCGLLIITFVIMSFSTYCSRDDWI